MAMSLPSCVDSQETTVSHRFSILNIGSHEQNIYIGKKFFDGNNYQSILKCLDGGYYIGTDLIKSMTDYRILRQADAARLTSYVKIYDSRLKQQSPLSSYNTTLRVQFQTVETFEKQVQIINECCENIQQVIDQYQKQIDEMYPRIRFSTTRKHYRTNEMENKFKRARSPLRKVLQTLNKLRKKKRKTRDALHNINDKIQDLNLDPTTNKDKKISEINKRRKKENKLKEIKENIIQAEKKRKEKENLYIAEGTKIFKQCQQLEKQRLDENRQALIDFNQAVHSSKYSNELDSIYEQLISNIKTQQDSIEDLNYWANVYGVNDLTITVSSETNDNDNDSAIDADDQHVDE